jgi:hypothetical protein
MYAVLVYAKIKFSTSRARVHYTAVLNVVLLKEVHSDCTIDSGICGILFCLFEVLDADAHMIQEVPLKNTREGSYHIF